MRRVPGKHKAGHHRALAHVISGQFLAVFSQGVNSPKHCECIWGIRLAPADCETAPVCQRITESVDGGRPAENGQKPRRANDGF